MVSQESSAIKTTVDSHSEGAQFNKCEFICGKRIIHIQKNRKVPITLVAKGAWLAPSGMDMNTTLRILSVESYVRYNWELHYILSRPLGRLCGATVIRHDRSGLSASNGHHLPRDGWAVRDGWRPARLWKDVGTMLMDGRLERFNVVVPPIWDFD